MSVPSELSFKIAGAFALRDAVEKAKAKAIIRADHENRDHCTRGIFGWCDRRFCLCLCKWYCSLRYGEALTKVKQSKIGYTLGGQFYYNKFDKDLTNSLVIKQMIASWLCIKSRLEL